ncbi:MAG: DsbA family protein [Reyranella sp.]|uniref:DsbA family protein n=1 Tax=Reyranella sp. TaxID=1929291 RepID=UPI001AC98EB0|nr:DsbA family protein [Reyranella sp.]MBN9086654.1 DsbA family protein [Reyranella sp.]
MRNILIVAGGVVAVAAIAAGVIYGTRPSSPGPVPQAVAQAPDKASLLNVQPTDHVLGDPKAPITMIEYASFTCPHCAHFSDAILPQVKKKWVDTGKVKLIYRDFPLDQTALKAAQLAECAGNDKYFGVVEMIFGTQQKWATASDPIGELAKSLRLAGMDDAAVKACLANEAVANGVVADYRGGETLGVNSTPTLFINGEQFKGARTVEELDAAFSKLAK